MIWDILFFYYSSYTGIRCIRIAIVNAIINNVPIFLNVIHSKILMRTPHSQLISFMTMYATNIHLKAYHKKDIHVPPCNIAIDIIIQSHSKNVNLEMNKKDSHFCSDLCVKKVKIIDKKRKYVYNILVKYA